MVQQGRHNLALAPLQKSGEVAEQTLAQILAAEAAGDLFGEGLGQWEKAAQFYETALAFQRRITRGVDSYGNKVEDRENLWKEDLYYKKRVQTKLAKAIIKRDGNRYGAGYVAFRRAERFRRQDFDFPSAFIALQSVEKDHPQTIWSEAATAYRIKTLLTLATMQPTTKKTQLSKRTKDLQRDIKNLQIALKIMEMKKIDKAIVTEMKKLITDEKKELFRLRSTPYGDAALQAALKLTKSFLAERELGLYRGEVMLAVGNFYLQVKLHPKRARKWHVKAAKWFDKIKAGDAEQDSFTVPTKAKRISAPPPTERQYDAWSNTVMQKPKIGDIFNRRTSLWYWGSLRKEIALKRGLIEMVLGNLKKAKNCWRKLTEIDPFFSEQEQEGWGSIVERLMWNLKNNKGCLYASPQEMKVFKERKLRLSVFLADLSFENEEHQLAGEKYAAILKGQYGKLNTGQKAYISYALAQSYAYQWRGKEVDGLLAKYDDEFKDTPSTSRALLMRAGRALMNLAPDSEAEVRGFKDYATLLKRHSKTQEAELALYYWGWTYYLSKRFGKARKKFRQYVRRYPKGIYNDAAKHFLGMSEKALASGKRSN